MMLTYGHEVTSSDDSFIRIAEKGVLTIEAAGAIGAHIVDFVPWSMFHSYMTHVSLLMQYINQ